MINIKKNKKSIEYKRNIYYNRFFVFIVRLISPLILRSLKTELIEVKENIPKKGPLLIAAHHEELADQYIIGREVRRRLFWVADTTPFGKCLADTHFAKWFMLRIGAIPIDKKNSYRNVNLFEHLLWLLGKGEAIVFFPEAYLKSERTNKRFGKFKTGVIRLALEYEKKFNKKIPIYPIGIRYNKIRNAEMVIGKKIIVKSKNDSKRVFEEMKRLSS